ncbi:MAG: helix-turn-helix domain-containing protein [Oscillospiraceae bacterium]|jgi:transcriptional regulator with XRE-family HTH domain|nr:helix-turn-helix domain-containing protein [Oscillospiraceae bacterium]
MFKNTNADGTLNLCSKRVAALRKERNLSQRALADELQLRGLDIGKNMIQQLESGRRYVSDIELKVIAEYFSVTTDSLLG